MLVLYNIIMPSYFPCKTKHIILQDHLIKINKFQLKCAQITHHIFSPKISAEVPE